jgi:Uma2 family endonuclease
MTELLLAVIKILSPTQAAQKILDKLDSYFQAEIRSCWLVTPFEQTASVCLSISKSEVFHKKNIEPNFQTICQGQ